MLTSRLVFARSDAQLRLFVDLARTVFIALHVDDLIMVGSSSQLYEVVSEMKLYFTMKVTLPLSACAAQTYVARGTCVTMMPSGSGQPRVVWKACWKEHGMTSANPVASLALARNGDDEDGNEANTEEYRIWRRVVGKSQFLAPRRPEIACATNRLARSLAKLTKADLLASKRLLRYLCGALDLGSKLQTHDSDSIHRQRLGV